MDGRGGQGSAEINRRVCQTRAEEANEVDTGKLAFVSAMPIGWGDFRGRSMNG